MEDNKNTFESLKHAFLKVPRKVLGINLDVNHPEHKKMRTYLFFLYHAYYSEGYVVCASPQKIVCHRGEYVGNYDKIVETTHLSKNSIKRYMKELQDDNLISIVRLKNAISIRITGYDELCGVAPAPEKKPSRAQKKKTGNAPASYSPPVCYGSNTRPVVYDENGQMITDGDEARRIVAERGKKKNN